jgi:hypothetical protein
MKLPWYMKDGGLTRTGDGPPMMTIKFSRLWVWYMKIKIFLFGRKIA